MKKTALAPYFVLLVIFCAGVILGARLLGRQGAYLAQFYMLTPALAAILTRLLFYKPRFADANLRLGRFQDYIKYWLLGLGIVSLFYTSYTLLGAITWDLSGNVFLTRLEGQFAAVGQDMKSSLPTGVTPTMMLMLYFIGGLTVFNIPGIITGFGEEFGHRGFMFPLLYQIRPWIGILVGGFLWFLWHLPLMLVVPQAPAEEPLWLSALNMVILAIGAICTYTYLAYVYVKTASIFVASIAHIAMNNAAMSVSYFVVVRNQILANLGTTLVMIAVVAILYSKKELGIFHIKLGQPTHAQPSTGS